MGVLAESQIQELFCSSLKFDHKISISEQLSIPINKSPCSGNGFSDGSNKGVGYRSDERSGQRSRQMSSRKASKERSRKESRKVSRYAS